MTDQPSTPPAPEPKPKAPRADQDQKIADRIADTREKILIVQADPELQALLTVRGFDPERLLQGLDLQDAAQTAFNNRQTAIGAENDANAAFAAANAKARQDNIDFRTTARKIFKKDPAAQATLGVTGHIAADAQKFVTDARASYAAALGNAAYLTELALDGYIQTAMQSLVSGLDALQAANTAQETAQATAVRATQLRDAADKTLAEWRSRFNTAATIATRERPDLAAKLGL